jgi:hypothetical protein
MLTFREFLALTSERIGAHLLPVQIEAHDIGTFLAADGVHHPLDRRLVRCIYRANRCGHLDAAICPDATFRALGRFLRELRGMPATDVDQVALVESVGAQLSELWQEHGRPVRALPPSGQRNSGSALGRFSGRQKSTR